MSTHNDDEDNNYDVDDEDDNIDGWWCWPAEENPPISLYFVILFKHDAKMSPLIMVHQITTQIAKWETSTWKKWTKRKHCQHAGDKCVCVTCRLFFSVFLSNNDKVDFLRCRNA